MSNSFEQPTSTDECFDLLLQLNNLCSSESLSLERLREHIERFGFDQGKNHDIITEKRSYTFFLSVCRNIKFNGEIIRYILDIFPEATDTFDFRGCTPLHHACGNGKVTPDIIRALVGATPKIKQNWSHETPLHLLCSNEVIDGATLFEILELLLTSFREAAAIAACREDSHHTQLYLPLYRLCCNQKVNLDSIRLLVKATPDALFQTTSTDCDTPLHLLNRNEGVDGRANEMIKFFLEKDPESVRKVNQWGLLPLHYACLFQSRECCSTLISAYPDSVQISDNDGVLPLHFACQSNNLETVQYLHGLYPDAVNQPTRAGLYPINFVAKGRLSQGNCDAVSVVRYLLDCDPRVKLQKVMKKSSNNILTRYSHISMFCSLCGYKESNVDISVEIIKVLYDANPKAIIYCEEHIRDLMGPRELRPELWEFIDGKLETWREVRETTLTFDEELRSLCGSESLSLVKLRETFNRFGLTNVDKNELIDCDHIAEGDFFLVVCNNENFSEEIIRFLLDFFPRASRVLDGKGFTPFHLACYNRRVTLNIIQLIHETTPDSVLQRAYNGYTPHHMLCQNEGMDEANLLQILQFLLRDHPGAADMSDSRDHPGAADMSDSNGCTPLHIACCNTNPSLNIIELLVGSMNETAGSPILRATDRGDTPLHLLCSNNKGVDRAKFLEILEFLLRVCQDAACTANANGFLPLHNICCNQKVNLDIIRSLVKAAPDTVCQSMSNGETPLHLLNRNEGVSVRVRDGEANEMIKFFLEQDPESACKVDMFGRLPLHYACLFQSRECCSTLISAYPDSVQISDNDGKLPLHFACQSNNLETVQYLHGLHPDAVNQPTRAGLYPINFVAKGLPSQDNCDAVSVVRYLLDCDPRVKLQKIVSRFGLDRFQLVWFCDQRNSNFDAGTTVHIVRALYDAYPQAIYDFEYSNCDMQEEVRAFIEGELVYAGQARDTGIRNRWEIDENGQLALQLHTALENNASLGSIKLLVEANPTAVRVINSNSSLPLHVACQHHNSPCVVQYLLDLAPESLQIRVNGNTILHLACRGAKCETIAMLLENTATNTASLASRRNDQGKLPIDLLFESSEVEDRESVEYIGTIFRLLQAYPETPWHSL